MMTMSARETPETDETHETQGQDHDEDAQEQQERQARLEAWERRMRPAMRYVDEPIVSVGFTLSRFDVTLLERLVERLYPYHIRSAKGWVVATALRGLYADLEGEDALKALYAQERERWEREGLPSGVQVTTRHPSQTTTPKTPRARKSGRWWHEEAPE